MTRLLSLLLALAAVPAAAADPGWQAGFAAVTITPTQPMWMSGYAARTAPAEGTETDLFAKAMVLRTPDGRRLVLVTFDLVGIDRRLSQRICEGIRSKHGLPREAVCLAVSHTHCGPVVRDNLRSMYFLPDAEWAKVERYTDALPGRVLEAVDAATAKLEPVTLSWAVGTAGFAVNRRENKEPEVPKLRAAGRLKGPVDHDVPVLAARDAGGRLKGIVCGYACHATVLSFQKWCGDYPGFATAELEAAHPGAVAMFVAGCGADQNPIPRRSVELARWYGKQLAAAVEAVLAKPMTPAAPEAAASYAEADLPLAEVPTREALVTDTTAKDKYVAARAKMLLEKLAAGQPLPAAYPYPTQAWRLGKELTWVFLGGEVVVDYSLRLKRELGPGPVWVSGYANDVMAYIPSARVLREGGYEGATSMVYYGLPAVWGPRVEDVVAAAAKDRAAAVRGK
jgi:hypothetical protein